MFKIYLKKERIILFNAWSKCRENGKIPAYYKNMSKEELRNNYMWIKKGLDSYNLIREEDSQRVKDFYNKRKIGDYFELEMFKTAINMMLQQKINGGSLKTPKNFSESELAEKLMNTRYLKKLIRQDESNGRVVYNN